MIFDIKVHKKSHKSVVNILYHTFLEISTLILHKVSDNFPSIYTKSSPVHHSARRLRMFFSANGGGLKICTVFVHCVQK